MGVLYFLSYKTACANLNHEILLSKLKGPLDNRLVGPLVNQALDDATDVKFTSNKTESSLSKILERIRYYVSDCKFYSDTALPV